MTDKSSSSELVSEDTCPDSEQISFENELANINSASLAVKENINYVTPYAFGVSPEIYGLPLARPRKRAMAMSIDVVVVIMLTHVSHILLFGLFAGLFLNAARHLKKQAKNAIFRKLLRLVGSICLLIFLASGLSYLISPDSNPRPEGAPTISVNFYEDSESGDEAQTKKETSSETDNPRGEDSTVQSIESEKPESDDSDTEFWSVLERELKNFGISFGWAAFYFSVTLGWFSGQTIGKRILGIKVIKQDGCDLNLWDAFGRYGGYGAGFATGLMGFLQVYWDPNRQAIQDKISGTLVIDLSGHRINIDS